MKEHLAHRPNPPTLKAQCYLNQLCGALAHTLRLGKGVALLRCTGVLWLYAPAYCTPCPPHSVQYPHFLFPPPPPSMPLISLFIAHSHTHTPLSHQSGFSGLLEVAAQDRK